MSKQLRIMSVFLIGIVALAGFLALRGGDVAAQDQTWRGEYYGNPNLQSPVTYVRSDTVIDFNWGDGGLAPGMPTDYFSVRWTKNMAFPAGGYRFAATIDDGARVYVNGSLLIDAWYPSALHTVSRDIVLPAGTHQIVMEYFEYTGQAQAKLDISPITGGGNDGGNPGGLYPNWKGEYFNNRNVSGAPVYVRDDRYIDFNWQKGSPVPGIISADNFSVRWTRNVSYPAGQYRIRLNSDDGARLFINDRLIINNWDPPAYVDVYADYWHAGGTAGIRLEYFEFNGDADIRLDLITVPGGGGVLPPPGYPGTGYPGSGGGFGGSGGTGGSGGGFGGGTSTATIPQCPGVKYPTGYNAVVITSSNLNMRRSPTTQSEIVGQFVPCQRIALTGLRDSSGQWVQTTLNGVPGWVGAQYLALGTPISGFSTAP